MGETPTEESSERSDKTAKLELPKLGLPRFGRRRRNRDATPVEEPAPPPERLAATEPEPAARVEPEPLPATEPSPMPEVAPEPAPEPAAQVEPEPLPATEPSPLPEVAPEPAPDPVAQAEPEEPVGPPVAEPLADEPEPAEDAETEREPFRLPALPGRLAAAITGLVVGAFGAMLTYLSLKGCDALRGTETCGGTGLLVLVVILVLMVLLGAALLAAWEISDPRSTSFLAVGVLSVIVMLTLMQQLYSPWMFLIVPLISAAAYVLSHWVTTAFIEQKPEDGPQHDVR